MVTKGFKSSTKSGYETKTFIFSNESAWKTRMNTLHRFMVPYLVPEIQTFKEPKHDTQTWFSADNHNSQNYGIDHWDIRLTITQQLHNRIQWNSANRRLLKSIINLSGILVVQTTFSVPGPFHSNNNSHVPFTALVEEKWLLNYLSDSLAYLQ